MNELKMCYKKLILASRQVITGLPVLSKKKEIFSLLDCNNCVIISAETGSGKSTQIPQILS